MLIKKPEGGPLAATRLVLGFVIYSRRQAGRLRRVKVMPFSIAFLDEPLIFPYEDPATPAAPGLLLLGDTKEYFCSSLHEWSKEDYESQWRRAIKTLLTDRDRSALITTYGSPEVATHLEWWPMYAQEEIVSVQDHLLFYDQLTSKFSIPNAFSFIRSRKTKDEEGNAVSEWRVNLAEIEGFAGAISLGDPESH
jgi:hypothetical protein